VRNWLIALLVVGLAAFSIAQTTRPAPLASATSQPSRVQDNQNSNATRPRNSRRLRRQGNGNFNSNNADRGAGAMPQIYELVAMRDIFVKGQQMINPADSQPRDTAPVLRNYGNGLQVQPTELVLTGVVKTDIGEVAFLENDQEQQVFRVQVGDVAGGGKISGISFDSIEFKDARGNVTHVSVGSNLAGGDVWGVSGGTPSTQPSSENPAVDSILERMRKRRLQELGQK
jgi:hypothetical protein